MMVLYAAQNWQPRDWWCLQKNIGQIQRPILLMLIMFFCLVPTSALQVLAGILPPEFILTMEKKMYKIRRGKPIDIDNVQFKSDQLEQIYKEFKHRRCPVYVRSSKAKQNTDLQVYNDESKIEERMGPALVLYINLNIIHGETEILNDNSSKSVLSIEKSRGSKRSRSQTWRLHYMLRIKQRCKLSAAHIVLKIAFSATSPSWYNSPKTRC